MSLMLKILLALIILFLILLLSEYLWRTKRIRGEAGRKFTHISVGTFVAFWPMFLSFNTIKLFCLALLVVVLISKKFNIFRSIHGVERISFGEALFAVGILLSAIFAQSNWIFTIAILHLSLADGLAGLIGNNYGKRIYMVLSNKRSFIGTSIFWLISVLLVNIFVLSNGNSGIDHVVLILTLPISATLVENLSLYGTDNVSVPLFVVLMLNHAFGG